MAAISHEKQLFSTYNLPNIADAGETPHQLHAYTHHHLPVTCSEGQIDRPQHLGAGWWSGRAWTSRTHPCKQICIDRHPQKRSHDYYYSYSNITVSHLGAESSAPSDPSPTTTHTAHKDLLIPPKESSGLELIVMINYRKGANAQSSHVARLSGRSLGLW